jgi:flagellin
MGLRINPGINLFAGQRQVSQSAASLQRGFEGLSSGLRINRARDDAAGLAIAEGFRSQVRQFGAEIGNLQQGVNFAQTTEGGLQSQQEAVGRLRELAVQASNGTLTDEQRGAINAEAQQLLEEIDTTAQNTEFNGQTPLENGADVDLGTEGDDRVTVEQSTASSLGIDSVNLSTQGGAQDAIAALDAASQQINQNRATVGAQQNRLERSISRREVASQNAAASESAIRDLDVGRASIAQARDQILLQASISSLAQGNIVPQQALRLLGG